MRRGVSSGGGESSLSYLFGSGEPPKPAAAAAAAAAAPPAAAAAAEGQRVKDIPAGIQGAAGNNYFRADGQNTGNFITVLFYDLLPFFYYVFNVCWVFIAQIIYPSR